MHSLSEAPPIFFLLIPFAHKKANMQKNNDKMMHFWNEREMVVEVIHRRGKKPPEALFFDNKFRLVERVKLLDEDLS